MDMNSEVDGGIVLNGKYCCFGKSLD